MDSSSGQTGDPAAGKVLLITGASSGIGAQTARDAVAAGWKVVLAARSLDRLEALAAELGADSAIAVKCDVTNWDDQQAAVAAAIDRFSQLDAVFANAGFGAARGFLEESVDHWRDMVLTNVLGVALTIRAALPELKKTHGHAVLTGSVAGVRSIEGSLYSATKFAVHGIGESLRLEAHADGIRVTVIAPGMTDTPFFDNKPEAAMLPEDISGAVMFVLSQPDRVNINLVVARPTAQKI